MDWVIGVTVQGNSVPITTGNSALAAIDTGTTLIGGPTNDVRAIWNAVGGTAIQGTPGFFQFRKFQNFCAFFPYLHTSCSL